MTSTRPGAPQPDGSDRADPPTRVDLDLPAVRLSALDYGEPGPGAPSVLVLHGQADLAWSMDSLSEALRSRFRVVALDLRGHGWSDHPGAYSTLHFIADVHAAVVALGLDRPVLVGHSLGGQVASQFTGLFPELVRALVVAEGIGPPVRLLDGGPAERAELTRQRLSLLQAPTRHRPMADLDAAVARLHQAHPRLPEERARFLAEVGTRPGPDGGRVWRFDPRTRHWLTSFNRAEAEERWAQVRCPTLVVTGAEAWERWWKNQAGPAAAEGWDGPDPGEIRRRVGIFADVEHVELSDAGHMLHFDQPDRLNEVVLGFLDRRSEV